MLHPRPSQPPLWSGCKTQGAIQQRLGRGVVEALAAPRRCVPQRPWGLREIAAQAGVVGHHHRVRIRPPAQHPAGLPGPAARPGLPWHSRPGPPAAARAELEVAALVGQELSGDRVLRIVEQLRAPRPRIAAGRSMSSSGPITAHQGCASSTRAPGHSSQRASTGLDQ